MKYLFINSVAGFGSTGRIAAEQCRGLMAQGHECVLAFGREEANCGDIPTVRLGTPPASAPGGRPGGFLLWSGNTTRM